MRVMRILVAPFIVAHCCAALTIAGLEVPHAKLSPTSRVLDGYEWPEKFPYSKQDLTPDWAGNDQMFYTIPKLGHHAGGECRASLTRFYECALPPSGEGDVLDLCGSFTSHFPDGWRARRCVALRRPCVRALACCLWLQWLLVCAAPVAAVRAVARFVQCCSRGWVLRCVRTI